VRVERETARGADALATPGEKCTGTVKSLAGRLCKQEMLPSTDFNELLTSSHRSKDHLRLDQQCQFTVVKATIFEITEMEADSLPLLGLSCVRTPQGESP
jgi:hypothetical protein